jgi:hypothetical protein
VQDLANLGLWICQEYPKHQPGKFSLSEFLERYGQEFYCADNKTISHIGTGRLASSYFSLSLTTGALLAILSNQLTMAGDLALMIRSEIFRQSNECTQTTTLTTSNV